MRGYENMTEAEIAARNARVRDRVERVQAAQAGLAGDPLPKPSKYRNLKTVVDGEKFDSQAEARHWQELKLREKAGDIWNLRRQVPFDLMCPVANDSASDRVVSQYVADFVFNDKAHEFEWAPCVQDVKGGRATKTAIYQLKKKWLYLQSGIEVEEIQ